MARPLTIVGGVVTIIAIVATVLIFSFKHDAVSLQITTLVSVVSPTLVALLALLRAEQTNKDIRNGKIVHDVKEAMTERAEEVKIDGRDDRR